MVFKKATIADAVTETDFEIIKDYDAEIKR